MNTLVGILFGLAIGFGLYVAFVYIIYTGMIVVARRERERRPPNAL